MTWFCGHLHVFPLAFIWFRLHFTAFRKAKSRFSLDSIKCVPFACIPKKMTHYFLLNLTSCFCSCHGRSCLHIGIFWGRGKSWKKNQKYWIFYTQNQPNFCWFQIVVFFLTISTAWVMKKNEKFSKLCVPSENLKISWLYLMHTSGTKKWISQCQKFHMNARGKYLGRQFSRP